MVNDTVEDTSRSHLIEDLLIDVSLRKQLAFEISIEEFRHKVIMTLNRLCTHSDDGYKKSIDVLDCFRSLSKIGPRFKIIIQTLNLLLMSNENASTSNNNYYKQLSSFDRQEYILELLMLINNLTKSPRDVKYRCQSRQEFISLNILEIFKSINKIYPQNSAINAEISSFISLRSNEEYEYASDSIDLNSHIDLFHAIFSQVQDTSNKQMFISLLRHLLKIDSSSKLGNFIWQVIEKLVCRAVLFERDDRMLSDALERYTDEKFKSILNTTPRDTAPQIQQPVAAQANMPPPPPPPPFLELILPKKVLPPNEQANSKTISNTEPAHQRQPKSSRIKLDNNLTTLKISAIEESGTACLQRLPQQQVPKAQVKMKQLIWSKIQPNRIVGNQSIWTKGSNVACREEAFFNEIEEFFKTSENPRAEPQAKDSCLNISAKNWHYNSTEKINLLDNKRSLNVNIYLKQFRCSPDEILELLANNDENLGLENLEGMLKIVPDMNEIELLKVYQGDIDMLGEAEKFLFKLIHVRNYKLRIESLILKEEFNGLMAYFNKTYESFFNSAEVVYNSVNLADILVLICRTGNFINEGNFSGNAAGFKLASLIKLSDLKSNKQNVTLLHVIAQQLEETNSQLIGLPKELEPLREISGIQLDTFKNEINTFCMRVKKLNHQLEAIEDNTNLTKLKAFIHESIAAISQLEKKETILISWKNRLSEHFCEDTVLFKLEDCFHILVTFSDKLKKCFLENSTRRCTELRRSSSVRYPKKYTNSGQVYARTSAIGFDHFNNELLTTVDTTESSDEPPIGNLDDLDACATRSCFFRRSSFRMSRKTVVSKRIDTSKDIFEPTRELPVCRSSFKDFHKINDSLLSTGNVQSESATVKQNEEPTSEKMTRRSLSTSEIDLELKNFKPTRHDEALAEEEDSSGLSLMSRQQSKSSSRLSGLKKLGNLYKTFEEDDSLFSQQSSRNETLINAKEGNEDCDFSSYMNRSALNARRSLFETASRQIQTDQAFSRNSKFRHTIHQSSSNIVSSRINKFESRSELTQKYLGADNPVLLKTSDNNAADNNNKEINGLNMKRISSVKINSILDAHTNTAKENSAINGNTIVQSPTNKSYIGHRSVNIVDKIEKFNSNNLMQIISSEKNNVNVNERCTDSFRLAAKKFSANLDDNEASLKDDGFETQSNASSSQTSDPKIEMKSTAEDDSISIDSSHKLAAYTNKCISVGTCPAAAGTTEIDKITAEVSGQSGCSVKSRSIEKASTSRSSKSLKQIKQSKTMSVLTADSTGGSRNKTVFRPVGTLAASPAIIITTLQKNKPMKGSTQSLASVKQEQARERTMSNSNLSSLSVAKKNSSTTNSNISLNESSRKKSGSSLYLNDTASTKAKKIEVKHSVNTNKDILVNPVTRNDSVHRKKSVLGSASTISLPTGAKEAADAKLSPRRNQKAVFDRLTRSSKNFKDMRPTMIIN